MSVRFGRREISPARIVLLLLVAIPLAWAVYLGGKLLLTERAIHKPIPAQANRVLTAVPSATVPAIIFPTARSGNTPAPTMPVLDTRQPSSIGTAATDLPGTYPPSSTSTPNAMPTPIDTTIKSWDGKSAIDVLLVGIDQRGNEPARTDTIIVARLDFAHDRVSIVSIPRDLYVAVPGFQYWKINAAYALGENPKYKDQVGGGIGLLIQTIQQDFGVHIDEYGLINFQGFQDAVNALGGIDINVPKKLVDTCYPDGNKCETIVFEPGPQHMDGDQALKYARTRHPDSDFGRMARQQQVILAVQSEARNPTVILQAPGLLNAVGTNVETSLSLDEQLKLARWAASLPQDHIDFYEITGPIGTTQGGESVVWPEWDKINPILQKVFGPQAGHRS